MILLANTKKKKTTKSSKKKNTKNTKKKNVKKQAKNPKKKANKKSEKSKPVKKASKKKSAKKEQNTKKQNEKKINEKKQNEKKINASKVNKEKIKAEEKKDIITIVVLTLIILAIIIFTLLSGANENVPINDQNTVYDTNEVNIIDSNTNVNNDLNFTEEEILQKAQELQTKRNVDIINEQLKIFETWYPELGLETTPMNNCIADNNYANPNLDIDNAKHIQKISEDIQLATILGVSGTPGIFVNGYKVDGYKDYNYLADLIEKAENTTNTSPFLNSDVNTYEVSNEIPTLHILYNEDNSITENTADSILGVLENKPYAQFFNTFFEDVEIVKNDYREVSTNIENVLKTLKVNSLPFFYLDGNVELLNMDENTQEVFDNLFIHLPTGGYIINVPQSQYFDSSILESENDYVYGDENAPVTIYLFDDYDCPYCQKLDSDVIPKVVENYVNTGRANIVIKDFVVHQAQALFPAIFSRCAQEQGKYWQTHTKLFENRDQFGAELVQGIFDKYQPQITELQNQYQQLLGSQ